MSVKAANDKAKKTVNSPKVLKETAEAPPTGGDAGAIGAPLHRGATQVAN